MDERLCFATISILLHQTSKQVVAWLSAVVRFGQLQEQIRWCMIPCLGCRNCCRTASRGESKGLISPNSTALGSYWICSKHHVADWSSQTPVDCYPYFLLNKFMIPDCFVLMWTNAFFLKSWKKFSSLVIVQMLRAMLCLQHWHVAVKKLMSVQCLNHILLLMI